MKRELATHRRVHSGEQTHVCAQCGKEFGTRQLLKKHWMWHTGERSHVCPHCGKAFFQVCLVSSSQKTVKIAIFTFKNTNEQLDIFQHHLLSHNVFFHFLITISERPLDPAPDDPCRRAPARLQPVPEDVHIQVRPEPTHEDPRREGLQL